MLSNRKLKAWSEGKIRDEDLSDKEVRSLQERLLKAIQRKLVSDPTKIVVQNTTRTVQ